MANPKLSIFSFTVLLTFLNAVQCKYFIRLADEYKKLDETIVGFIKKPTKVGWEDNLLDMAFYVRSLQNMVRELDGGITFGTFIEAERVMNGGMPSFIDLHIDDETFIMNLNIADEQLERFYYMQKFAKIEWEDFIHDVKHKKTMANLLL